MPQNTEAEAFIAKIIALPSGPTISLDEALRPSLEDEAELRRLFASDKDNARLSEPYVGLVDIFDAPAGLRTTRARIVKDEQDLDAKYVMPLTDEVRRKEGSPSMVQDLDEFKKNWSIFTEGSLSQLLDWNNVVAAGGSVLACLTPLSDAAKASKRAIRKFYHSVAYPTSDVDLFLWGLTPEQAEVKINAIFEAVRDSVPWDVTCVRTKHTISIHSQYPYRSVQIVLRLYRSPAEILAGFDVDAPCCAYDGRRVWTNPRAIAAMMRQCNTVDMTRRSPSYEVRLAKYSSRAFEVYIPSLVRESVDPTIYERSIAKIEGLARLLVFERLKDGDTRYAFLESRRQLRGRPNPLARYNRNKRRYNGDLKEDNAIGGLEINDYDVASLHIPYGPGWDARRIDKLVYQTDLGMNSTFNPKNKGRRLHRHPAFFGTMQECIEDCCENCPETIDEDERNLQVTEDENYVRGRITFIEENPGRQTMTGSFNPIDVGEWSEQVYVKETEQFFAAIAANNMEAVKAHLQTDIDLNHRDHVGRTSLHVSIISKAPQVAIELIEAGARISARLVDGRSSLHLAAQYDQVTVVKKLLERSAINEEQAKKEAKDKDDGAMDEDVKKPTERPSSDDDWSSDENDGKDVEMEDADDEEDDDDDDGDGSDEDEDGDDQDRPRKSKSKLTANEPPPSTAGDLPEDNEEEPDILNVNEPDWDFGFTPLSYAVVFASVPVVEVLITFGADVRTASKTNHHDAAQLHPLTLTILRENEEGACKIAERLIAAGASSSTADEQLYTIFHSFVNAGKVKLASTVLRCDPNAKSVIDFPAVRWSEAIFPIVTAINKRDYSMVTLLLAHGVKVILAEEDITRAQEAADPKSRPNLFGYGVKNYMHQAYQPLETAIAQHDDIVQLLMAFGTPYNSPLKNSVRTYARPEDRRSIKDWVDFAIKNLTKKIEEFDMELVNKESQIDTVQEGFKEYTRKLQNAVKECLDGRDEGRKDTVKREREEKSRMQNDTKEYLTDVHRLLVGRYAKTWQELFPDIEVAWPMKAQDADKSKSSGNQAEEGRYVLLSNSYRNVYTPAHMNKAYDELFEACFNGDNDKIQSLCLPKEGTTSSGTIALNIAVQVADPKSLYWKSGFTPLFAACCGRKWSTARLVIAIATAQYHPENEDEEKVDFSIDSDNDSDNDSDDSDATVEKKKEVMFVDVAKSSSTVRTNIHPKMLINDCSFTWRVGNDNKFGNLVYKAVLEKDLDAFINIANLYQSLSDPVDLGENLLESIIEANNPQILDEYIRRTGYGLDFDVAKKETADIPLTVNDKNKVYLGLNVHGKKRADLARKGDPNAHYSTHVDPLLWRAATAGATAIIEYLTTDKPIVAFRHHATSHSDSRAEQLRRIPDLGRVLPGWLGWNIGLLGESALSAAVIGNNLAALQLLFKLKPQLMKSALHEKIKFVGHNLYLLAVATSGSAEILDFLSTKSVSPADRDLIKGWNVFHYASVGNKCETLAYLLSKLPRDVSQTLLSQESKKRLNTPLHLAVKVGAKKAVELIINFDPSTVLRRNVDGQTPLHCAASAGYSEIVKLLVSTPQHGGLFMEDGIGQTPYEVSALKELASRLRMVEDKARIQSLSTTDAPEHPARIDVDNLRDKMNHLRETDIQLRAAGIPRDIKQFEFDLNVFYTLLDSKLEEARIRRDQLPAVKKEEIKNPVDFDDQIATTRTFREIFGTTSASRQLIHLTDVQHSVRANLERVAEDLARGSDYRNREEDDMDHEEDEEEKERQKSKIFSQINTNPDSH